MAPATKALLVEDEFLIAADMEMVLADMGLTPVVAASIPEALALVADGGIDVAILDYRIGNTHTEAVGAALRERRIPFALCSGSTQEDAGSAFHGAPFVAKPYTDEILRDTVRRLLQAPDPVAAG
jgi:DNA-binding NtrC family response regulator